MCGRIEGREMNEGKTGENEVTRAGGSENRERSRRQSMKGNAKEVV